MAGRKLLLMAGATSKKRKGVKRNKNFLFSLKKTSRRHEKKFILQDFKKLEIEIDCQP